MELHRNITARRNPNFYMISNTWGKVARFCLFKPAYKLGEDIVGTFDFTVATVNCVQVSVSLQCEEETNIDPQNEKSKQTRIITYSKHHEVCIGYKYTQLILPIPLHVTPAFNTKLADYVPHVQKDKLSLVKEDGHHPALRISIKDVFSMALKWRLHFEFVTSTNKGLENPKLDQYEWQSPSEISVETMVWSLPIRLYSTTPIHVAQSVQANNVYKLTIR